MESIRGNGTVSISYNSLGQVNVCVQEERRVGSFGVFYGERPFNFVLPVTLCQLFIFIVVSRAFYYLLRPLRTPKFISNVLSGIVLGPSFLGHNKTYWETLFPAKQGQFLILGALVGCVYFLFFIALKMDVMLTMKAARRTWRLGVFPLLISVAVISTLVNHYYNPANFSPYKVKVARSSLSLTMSLSNYPVVSDALIELNLIATDLGQIALSSSMINDSILWCLVVVNGALVEKNLDGSILYFCFLGLFILFSFFILRPTMTFIAKKTPVGQPVKEVYLVFILLGVLFMAGLGDVIGITFLLGPLIFGLVIPSGPPLGTTIMEKSEIIVNEFLLPFFFIYVGMNTNLAIVIRDWRVFLTLQGIFLAGNIVKMIACALVCLTYNIRPKKGMVLGVIMNAKGITELICFCRLRKLQLLDDEMFSHLVFCVVVTAAIVSPSAKLLYKNCPRLLHSEILYGGQLTIQSTSRIREFRIVCCVHNEGNVRGITSLLEVCNPVPESPVCAYVVHLIELFGKSSSILLPINYKENKRFLSVNYPNTNHIMRAFENYSSNSTGPVTVLPYINVAPYKSMHDAVCSLAQDKMVPFIVIPFHENDNVDLDGHVSSSVHKMNARFQAHAPCTLGILVDRYSRFGASNEPSMFFHVGIFFIGGADDREALALGIRMSERHNTRVTLFRFIVMNKRQLGSTELVTREEQEAEETDIMLDEGLVDEFKSMNYRHCNLTWYEITVEDGVEVLDAIHRLEGNYDLVTVGRRHSIESLKDEEMANFIENAESLGIVGDMLSSTEFCIGVIPVLVIQCGGERVSSSKLDSLGSINASQKSSLVDK
ncbi:cation/H(+) antiporter 15-like [Abrus precatorius]|uniref:Cation/H(+) antiporter 15-like n=1 Tax=Abrus precatorius TaxID=3816 RepID=A0A8B8K3E1_ABRPR|nr:cation/H(+) antiporter 15-like [Abrus precatorius]